VVSLLCDPSRLAAVREQALAAGQRYMLDNMVNNFVQGIEKSLALPR
jgi:hypothetical protein